MLHIRSPERTHNWNFVPFDQHLPVSSTPQHLITITLFSEKPDFNNSLPLTLFWKAQKV